MPIRTKSATTIAIALSLGLALSACAAGGSAEANRSLYSVHQPVVERQNFSLDVSAGSSGLSIPEKARLADWFTAMNIGYGDQIALDGRNISNATREDIAALASSRGVMLSNAAPVTDGYAAPGSVRVVLSRSVASVPTCPNWEGRSANHLGNNTSANFGCAVNSNLAAMVANPDHLLQGASDTGSTSIMSSNKAIEAYRTAPPTGAGGDVAATSTRQGR